MTEPRPQTAVFVAARRLQRADAQRLAREWLASATHLAGESGPLRIAARQKLATVPLPTRLLIDKHAREAIIQLGPASTADPARTLAISAVSETALALEARPVLTAEEFEALTLPWTTVIGPELINPGA